ncbi:MAG TPA: tRNA 2-thiouridine(34) synthase MnmA [Nitrospirota bacterium]|nr:tRNA 2-thiouridine(34) synthase MnmA [Nitrospirota bacterium]
MKKRVLVAMSGGVDSSVTAALLQEQGYDVEGVTMKLTAGLCCDIGSAQATCHHLGVMHHIIDAQAEFAQGIVQDFISEYRRGRTPNPCIRCNDLVKFQLLLEYARSNSFDFLATGHYARIAQDKTVSRLLLKRGTDSGKDQSYFLYRLTQEQMKSILFPLGEIRKVAVRKLACELALPTAERPESQEICFVPDNNYRSFLKEHSPETLRPGDMVMTDGKVVGRHNGIAFFTVGQRRKLGVAAGERLYVVRVEPETNRVVIGKLPDLQTEVMTVSSLNFIPFDELRTPINVAVKIRYRSPFAPAAIEPMGADRIRVLFDTAVTGVCPGQAAVFYDGDIVVGGGIIETPEGMHSAR